MRTPFFPARPIGALHLLLTRALLAALVLAPALAVPAAAQTSREVRGAWIATVGNIDWPVQGAGAVAQKQHLVEVLDRLRSVGVNTVYFQVRSESDAMYESQIEPWSYWVSGQQGFPPGFDPLRFAIAEAHRRGMELHAWFNPYQVQRNLSGAYTTAPNHLSRTQPQWTMVVGNRRVLNPGLDAVSRHVARVVGDVVRRYDVDGIHFDDYFYFEGMTAVQDSATFNAYRRGGGTMALGDWRRDNVNRMVAAVHDTVRTIRPSVRFGISPTGIRLNSDANTRGYESYTAVFADGLAWLRAKTVDYIVPQVYWYIGKPAANYAAVVPWWAAVATERHLYIGQPGYKIGTTEDPTTVNHTYAASTLGANLRFNRAYGAVRGSIIYNTSSLTTGTNGRGGLADTLRRYWTPLAVPPTMPWKGDATPPSAPTDVRWASTLLDGTPDPNTHAVEWAPSPMAADGDTARFYGVYAAAEPVTPQRVASGAARLVAVVGNGQRRVTYPAATAPGSHVAVVAFDDNWNESALASAVDAEAAPAVRVETGLEALAPNPVARGEAVRIAYTLALAGHVRVDVYDVLGRHVAALVDAQQNAALHEVRWTTGAFSPGAYVVQLQVGGLRTSQRLMVR